jgi:NTE family protein
MYGLVLGGGGAKGAYQIGVWKALNELKIDVGIVCGTSVGALNGAFFAQKQYKRSYEMWANIKMEDVFEGDEEVFQGINEIFKEKSFHVGFKFVEKLYKNIIGAKGLDITPLRKMVDEYLDEDKLRKSEIDFGFVTISISDKKVLRLYKDDVPNGQLKEYLLGSAMVPGFAQDEHSDKKFIDGGVYDNFPIKMVYDKGYKKIIGVSLFQTKFKGYKDADVIYIAPSMNLGNFLFFDKDKAVDNIEMGYLDALKAFDKVYGFNYYFENVPSKEKAFKIISSIPYEDKVKITKLVMKIELENERMFYEKVIPKIAKELDVLPNQPYSDIIVKCMEKILESKKEKSVQLLDFKKEVRGIKNDSFKGKLEVYNLILKSYK